MVTIDSLEDNGGERAVKHLRCQDMKAPYQKYSTYDQGKKPVVEVKLIIPPGYDYWPGNSLFTLCPAAEVLGDSESDKPGLVAEYTKKDKNSN